jgi:metal iron transporter
LSQTLFFSHSIQVSLSSILELFATMNCPSRTEEPEGTGFNQNPSALSADLTTREDLNGMANTRELRRISSTEIESGIATNQDDAERGKNLITLGEKGGQSHVDGDSGASAVDIAAGGNGSGRGAGGIGVQFMKGFMKMRNFVVKYGKFVGPGFMVCHHLLLSPLEILTLFLDICGLHRPGKLLY